MFRFPFRQAPPSLPPEVRPSRAVRFIRQFPFGRRLALRIYNRLLIHLAPTRTIKTYFGAEFECDVNDLIGATLTHFGTWEPNTSRVVSAIVQPGDVVVDLGANIGYYTLLFAQLAGKGGKVIAVEALPKIALRLKENLTRNSADNVLVLNVAAAHRRGMAAIYEGPSKNIGATTIRADRGFSQSGLVEARSIDDIVGNEDAKRTSLIKIDIEGAEVPIVARILDSLDRYSSRLAIIAEIDTHQNPEWRDLFDRFLDKGFKAFDLANQYIWLDLVDGIKERPTPLGVIPPDGRVDVLFSRTGAPTFNESPLLRQ